MASANRDKILDKKWSTSSGTTHDKNFKTSTDCFHLNGSSDPEEVFIMCDAGDKKKMKVLYDFEAVEDNELSFKTGDIITILDDSDPNWWKGEGANGIGLFPSNFVTADLTEDSDTNGIIAETEACSNVKLPNGFSEPVLAVNEELLNKTLYVLQSTDPETTSSDSAEVLQNEETCLAMGRLIDSKLKDLDKQHLDLTLLNEKILESLQLYDKLMNQMPVYPHNSAAQSSRYTPSPQHSSPAAAAPFQPSSAVYTPAVNPNYQYSHPSLHPSAPGQSNIFPLRNNYH